MIWGYSYLLETSNLRGRQGNSPNYMELSCWPRLILGGFWGKTRWWRWWLPQSYSFLGRPESMNGESGENQQVYFSISVAPQVGNHYGPMAMAAMYSPCYWLVMLQLCIIGWIHHQKLQIFPTIPFYTLDQLTNVSGTSCYCSLTPSYTSQEVSGSHSHRSTSMKSLMTGY